MITEYHRPTELKEALTLLARSQPPTLPLAGGTVLNRPDTLHSWAVVDLQALGLNQVEHKGATLRVGATVRLQDLLAAPGLPDGLADVICQEGTINLRRAATAAGALLTADGRSAYGVALLALDTMLELQRLDSPNQALSAGEWFARRTMPAVGASGVLEWRALAGGLVTGLVLPASARLAYAAVARTPADLPIVCVAAARWPSGRLRLAVGGFGPAPKLALDGPESGDGVAEAVAMAAADVCREANDAWASAEYRSAAAATLARRVVRSLGRA